MRICLYTGGVAKKAIYLSKPRGVEMYALVYEAASINSDVCDVCNRLCATPMEPRIHCRDQQRDKKLTILTRINILDLKG